MGKGGALHFAKPLVDGGLLFSCLDKHKKLVAHLGEYESISRNGGPSFEGLVSNAAFIEDLLLLEPSAELNPASVKTALLRVLSTDASLNQSKFNGQVWINLRQERICTLLCHVRKAVRDKTSLQQAALRLCGTDMLLLKRLLDLTQLPLEKGQEATDVELPFAKSACAGPSWSPWTKSGSASSAQNPWGKGGSASDASFAGALSDGGQTVSYDVDEKGERPRTLKKVISEVSVGSDGFPSMLKTAEDEEAAPCDRDCVSNPCEKDSVFVSSLGTKTSPEAFKSFEKKETSQMRFGI